MNSTISSFAIQFNEKIFNFFSDRCHTLKCLAFQTSFIKRERKLTASHMIKVLTISSFRSKASTLVDIAKMFRSLDPELNITPQSLQERINTIECVDFVKSVFADVLQQKIFDSSESSIEALIPFRQVLLQDSSQWELSQFLSENFRGHGGNGSKSALKIDTIYDVKSGQFVHLKEHPGVKSDQTLGQDSLDILKKNDLLIRDLGYLKISNLDEIQKKGAYYLSRISGSMTIRLKKKMIL